MTKIKRTALFIVLLHLPIALLLVISDATFASFEVAMLSGAMITMGSLYAYRNMIHSKVGEAEIGDHKDAIDMMEDPYDLYDDERDMEIADVKEMIKAEKQLQKKAILENTVKNGSALISIYRVIPYVFFAMGFVILQNSHMMQLLAYLVGLGYGIVIGYLIAKEWFIGHSSD
ncbi:MAG: hypothetical protein Q8S36_03035 [Sulfuricurvum sp.]|nr:hypothetical protein [Sulfuricurvum sp.]